VFSFEEVAQGVMLTITESGFEQIPPARGKAFTANEKGWSVVVNLVCPLRNGDPKILRCDRGVQSRTAPVLAVDRSVTHGLHAGAEDSRI
jgi:hypothetical protein